MKSFKTFKKDFSALNKTQQKFVMTVLVIKILVVLLVLAVFAYAWKTILS